MFYGFIAVIGIFLGVIISRFTKDEFKQGSLYFKILEIIILFVLTFITIKINFNYLLFIFGIIIGFFVRYEYFYFGVSIVNTILVKDFNFLISSLVFLYGLPFGTLLNLKNIKSVILQIVLFLLPVVLYFLNFNLISFCSGALLFISLLKIHKLLNFNLKH